LGKRKKIIVRSIIVLIILTITIFLRIEPSRFEVWVCAGCGSAKSADWHFGIRTSKSKQVSPLEEWMINHKVAHKHDWRFTCGVDESPDEGLIVFSDGKLPPISHFPPEHLIEYINSASEADIKELTEVLENGSEEDQEMLIEGITEEWLEEKK